MCHVQTPSATKRHVEGRLRRGKQNKTHINWLTIWEKGKRTSALRKHTTWGGKKKATVWETYFTNQENSKLVVRKKNKRGHRLKKQCKGSSRWLVWLNVLLCNLRRVPTSQQDKIKHRFENDEEYIESGYIINVRKGKESEVAQSCPTLCDPRDCSPPGSSVPGIFQAIVLERIAISFSRGSSRSRDGTHISCIDRWIF